MTGLKEAMIIDFAGWTEPDGGFLAAFLIDFPKIFHGFSTILSDSSAFSAFRGPSAVLMLLKLVPQITHLDLQKATAELVASALRVCQEPTETSTFIYRYIDIIYNIIYNIVIECIHLA